MPSSVIFVDDTVDQLADRVFAPGIVIGVGEVLLGDDVGRVLGPEVGYLYVACSNIGASAGPIRAVRDLPVISA